MSKGLIGKLHDAVFVEEEVKPTPLPVPSPVPVNPIIQQQQYHESQTQPAPSDISGSMYDKLKSHTDFANAATLQKLLALEKPLEGIITDPSLRLKAAMATAASQGITPQMISGDLDELARLIDSSVTAFNDSYKRNGDGIAGDEQKAADLERQLHDLRQDITDRKTKLDRAQYDFNSAVSRRRAELDQLKSRFVF